MANPLAPPASIFRSCLSKQDQELLVRFVVASCDVGTRLSAPSPAIGTAGPAVTKYVYEQVCRPCLISCCEHGRSWCESCDAAIDLVSIGGRCCKCWLAEQKKTGKNHSAAANKHSS